MTLLPSDYTQIIGIGVSLLTSIIAMIVSVMTLRQNSKMIESTSRPYVTIYIDSVTICEQQSYFVIKNFGQSAAYITDFIYPSKLDETAQAHKLMNEAFSCVKDSLIAPGQSFMLPYKVVDLPDELISFSIKYSSGMKSYSDNFTFNPRKFIHIPKARPDTSIPEGDERSVQTLREIVERLM